MFGIENDSFATAADGQEVVAMSDTSQGEGWWLASEDREQERRLASRFFIPRLDLFESGSSCDRINVDPS
jgi:hypothetical protein